MLECFATTGDADYHLRVVVQDMAAYNRFLDEFMFRIPGIRYVRSNVVLKEIKYERGAAVLTKLHARPLLPSITTPVLLIQPSIEL